MTVARHSQARSYRERQTPEIGVQVVRNWCFHPFEKFSLVLTCAGAWLLSVDSFELWESGAVQDAVALGGVAVIVWALNLWLIGAATFNRTDFWFDRTALQTRVSPFAINLRTIDIAISDVSGFELKRSVGDQCNVYARLGDRSVKIDAWVQLDEAASLIEVLKEALAAVAEDARPGDTREADM